MIATFTKLIPRDLLGRSGAVFYSGAAAFEGQKDLYILGLNPGGSPNTHADKTINMHTQNVLNNKPSDWSEYRDEVWANGPRGTAGMQPRVRHLLGQIGLSPGSVPSSNVVFVRTAREVDLAAEFPSLAEHCWPVHEAVIRALKVRVVLCFGQRCGNWVRKHLAASTQVDEFVERNQRRWTSRAYSSHDEIRVVVATHPSRADWTTKAADPSALVERMLRASRRPDR